jgi:hypothetical protein
MNSSTYRRWINYNPEVKAYNFLLIVACVITMIPHEKNNSIQLSILKDIVLVDNNYLDEDGLHIS